MPELNLHEMSQPERIAYIQEETKKAKQAGLIQKPAIEIDSIVVEIIDGAIDSTMKEMEILVERTSMSTVIREQHDFRTCIYAGDGRMVSHASFSGSISPIIRSYGWEDINEGDVFLMNDPYWVRDTGCHPSDIILTIPVFYQGKIVVWTQSFGHVTDVGGMDVGSMPPNAHSIIQEAHLTPAIKLYDHGKLNVEAKRIILRNTRLSRALEVDIDAEISACKLAERRIHELCKKYGADVVEAAFDVLIERCKTVTVQEVFPRIPDGEWSFSEFAEASQDGASDDWVKLLMTLRKKDGKVTLDYSGSDRQTTRTTLNCPGDAVWYKKYMGCFLKNLLPTVTINHGIVDAFDMVLPEGTVLTPTDDVGVGLRFWTMFRMGPQFLGVLCAPLGGQTSADFAGVMLYGIYGENFKKKFFFHFEIIGAGGGGRPYGDGPDVVDAVPDSKNVPSEALEQMVPLTQLRNSLVVDSGGPGKYRGGLGNLKEVRVEKDDLGLIVLGDRTRFGCFGLMGGKAGGPGTFEVNPGTPEAKRFYGNTPPQPILKKGDICLIQTPGGGGWGDPLDRDLEAVRLDLIQGKVSLGSASRDYGVVFDPTTLEKWGIPEDSNSFRIDGRKTEKLREKMRKGRPQLKMVDRGPYFEKMLAEGKVTLTERIPTVEEVLSLSAGGPRCVS